MSEIEYERTLQLFGYCMKSGQFADAAAAAATSSSTYANASENLR